MRVCVCALMITYIKHECPPFVWSTVRFDSN